MIIGFLGRGPYAPTGARRPYRKTRYAFPDGFKSSRVPFFVSALIEWQTAVSRMPDRIIVLGTPGSMWDELLLSLGPANDPALEEFYEELSASVDAQQVQPPQTERLQTILSEFRSIEVYAKLVPPGITEEEQAAILQCMQQHVESGDQVYLDVTHGYRHQPMLAFGAAILLSQLRNAKIEGIHYGANEMRGQEEDSVPVVSLTWLLDLLAWADGLQQLRTSGRLRALNRVIRHQALQEALAKTEFFLSTNRIHQAGQAAKRCLGALNDAPSDPILDLTREKIREILDSVAGCQHTPQGKLDIGREALASKDYVRAAILLAEVAVDLKEQRSQLKPTEKREIFRIKDLRNALAHAGRADDSENRKVLESRKLLERELQGWYAWVENMLS